MAIVSISRIQVRRGREVVDGVPQLAGGELAWAVDTQKLYIGNGAVSEGAPAVGNTELLSTKSNLFDLADQYVYRKTLPNLTGDPEISRTLQERLDDTVTIRSFGAQGDNTDQTDKIQKAVDQLFANTDKSQPGSRVTLKIQAGEYRLSDSIKIPPHTNIVGDGSSKTIFIQSTLPITSAINGNRYQIVTIGNTDFTTFGSADNNIGTIFTMTNSPGTGTGTVIPIVPIFETVNDTRTTSYEGDQSQTTTLNQAREIRIEGVTLQTTGDNIGLLLRDCSNSEFIDVQIKSDWVTGNTITDNSIGIKLESLSNRIDMTNCANNKFDRVRIEGFSNAMISQYDSLMIDNVFSNGIIEMCGYGIVLGKDSTGVNTGTTQGPRGNKFVATKFIDIDKNGIIVYNGEHNISSKNIFRAVGNEGAPDDNSVDANAPITPTWAVIDFKSVGNKSDSDFFARTYPLAVNSSFAVGTPYVPEITGHHAGEFTQSFELPIPYNEFSNSPQTVLRLPADVSKNIEIDYVFKSENYDNERTGTIFVNVDKNSDTVSMDDEFRYSGTLTSIQPNPSFTVELGESGNNTLLIKSNYSLQATGGQDDGILYVSIRSTF